MRRPSRTEALMPVLSANKAQEEQINTSYEPLTPSVITDEKAQSYIEALNFACQLRVSPTMMITKKKREKPKRKQSSTASCNNCSIKRKKVCYPIPVWSAFLT